MKQLKKVLKCKKGNSYPLAVAIALAIVLAACGAFEYMRLVVIAQGVRDGVQSAVISAAAGNYGGVYASLREGYSGGYANGGSGFNEQISLGDVYGRLAGTMGLRREGGYYVKYSGSVLEYRVSGLEVNVINAPFAPADRNAAQKFLAEATIQLEVPLSFGWSKLPPMKIALHCKAGWTPRF